MKLRFDDEGISIPFPQRDVHVYHNSLDTAGSQSYPSPEAAPNADGSTTIYFSSKQPQDVKEGNWIQTEPTKGWFTILRLYSPLQSFFDKSWRLGEIELVK